MVICSAAHVHDNILDGETNTCVYVTAVSTLLFNELCYKIVLTPVWHVLFKCDTAQGCHIEGHK